MLSPTRGYLTNSADWSWVTTEVICYFYSCNWLQSLYEFLEIAKFLITKAKGFLGLSISEKYVKNSAFYLPYLFLFNGWIILITYISVLPILVQYVISFHILSNQPSLLEK